MYIYIHMYIFSLFALGVCPFSDKSVCVFYYGHTHTYKHTHLYILYSYLYKQNGNPIVCMLRTQSYWGKPSMRHAPKQSKLIHRYLLVCMLKQCNKRTLFIQTVPFLWKFNAICIQRTQAQSDKQRCIYIYFYTICIYTIVYIVCIETL